MKETNLFKSFFESEKAGGIILIFATLFSLLLANSIFQTEYLQIWNIAIGNHSLVHWINDGLMTIFFLLIGLELAVAAIQAYVFITLTSIYFHDAFLLH